MNIWIKHGQKEEAAKKGPLTLSEVMKTVWRNAQHGWTELKGKIISGNVTFKEFQQCFQNMHDDILKQQLRFLSEDSKDWIQERMKQYQQYKVLEQSVYGANVILKVAREYELKGDFQPIRMIEKMVTSFDITFIQTKIKFLMPSHEITLRLFH